MTRQDGRVDPARRLYLTLVAVVAVGLVVLGVAVATTPERSALDPWRARAVKVCGTFAGRVGRPGSSLAQDAAELTSFAQQLSELPPPDHRAREVTTLPDDMARLARLRAASAAAAAQRNVDDLMASATMVGEADRLSAKWAAWFGKEGMTPCLLVLTPRSS